MLSDFTLSARSSSYEYTSAKRTPEGPVLGIKRFGSAFFHMYISSVDRNVFPEEVVS